MNGWGPARVVSRWYVAAVVTLFVLVGAGGVAGAAGANGAAALAWQLMVCWVVLGAVATGVALAGPRRTALPAAGADGAVVVRTPLVLVVALLGAWAAILAAGAVWGFLMATDLARVDPAGPIVVMVLGCLGSLPELARLLTGRLHRWGLVLTEEGLTYQGYRRARHEPWSAVRGASVARGRNGGVVVDVRGARPDLLVPVTVFLVHPDAIADAIEARAAGRP